MFSREIWNFNDVDLDGLNSTLSSVVWNDVFDAALFNTLTLFIKDVFLYRNLIIRPRDKPWMTGHICQSIRKRHRLLKIHSKCKPPVSWDRYRVQRNLVVCLVGEAKTYCKLLAILQHLPKTGGAW